MHNPTILSMLAKVHRSNLLEEAKKSRIPRVIRAARPRFHERFLVRVGDLLISIGFKLQERYRPTMYSHPKSVNSC